MLKEIPTDTIVDKVFESFKRLTPGLVALSLGTCAVLFLPKNILERIGLNELAQNSRTIVGVIFLLSTTIIVTIVFFECFRFAKRKIAKNKRLRLLRRKLIALAPEEKEIIVSLLKSEDKCIYLDIASGNTKYLYDNKFIYRPEQLAEPDWDGNIYLKYVPHSWLIDLYNNEPNLFL